MYPQHPKARARFWHLEALDPEALKPHYEVWAARLAEGEMTTKVRTFHEFLEAEVLYKTAFAQMGKMAKEEVPESSKAMAGVYRFFSDMYSCTERGGFSKYFGSVVRERCKAAVHIVFCGLPEDAKPSEDGPRR